MGQNWVKVVEEYGGWCMRKGNKDGKMAKF